jgi:hypothetical protein
MLCRLTTYCLGDKVKKGEVGGVLSRMRVGEKKSIQSFVREISRKDHLEDLGVDGGVILK